MTQKQKKFCREYIITLNATEAAKKAGYSEKTAYSTGNENLKKPEIRAYIEKKLKEQESEQVANTSEVLKYLTSVMRGNSVSEVVVTEFVGDGISEARNMNKLPDEKEKLKAAELLGKRYSLFTDRLDIDGDMNFSVKVDYGDDDEDDQS